MGDDAKICDSPDLKSLALRDKGGLLAKTASITRIVLAVTFL